MEKSASKEEVVYIPTGIDSPLQSSKMGKNIFLYFTAAIACLIVFAAGAAISWTSPVTPKLSNPSFLADNPIGRVLETHEASWIAALLNLGGAFGPLIAGQSADRVGRKLTLLILAMPMIISFLVTAFARSVMLYFCARFMMGLSVGAIFNVLPMYLSEIAEDHNRGIVTCLMANFCSSGILFSYLVGPFLSVQYFTLVCLIPLIIYVVVFVLFLPDSPIFLAVNGNKTGLEQCLRKIRSKTPSQIEKEVEEIMKTTAGEQKQSQGGFSDLFKSASSRQGLFTMVGLIVLQQFSGINAVLFNMQTIFDSAGSTLSPETATIIVGLVQVITTVMTSSVVDRLGRRILFLISSIGCGFSLVVLGLYFYLQTHEYNVKAISWLPIACLLVYIITFNLGLGPLPWTVMAEFFVANVRSVASTIISSLCFFGAFLITLFFPTVADFLGMAMSFWFFSVVCGFLALFIYWKLPETKGRTIQEIQDILSGGKA